MVVGGGRLVYITYKLEQNSPSLQIPLAIVYAIIPISGLLILFYKLTQHKE
jgi:TRAP-type C4-dicarboxylate transport system permease small subunit